MCVCVCVCVLVVCVSARSAQSVSKSFWLLLSLLTVRARVLAVCQGIGWRIEDVLALSGLLLPLLVLLLLLCVCV